MGVRKPEASFIGPACYHARLSRQALKGGNTTIDLQAGHHRRPDQSMHYRKRNFGFGVLMLSIFMLFACGQDTSLSLQAGSMSGAQLAEAKGCTACHTHTAESTIGPGWVLPWGEQRLFSDGTSMLVDEAYLRMSMLEPALKVVQGYENIMLPAELTETEMALLVAFIRELSSPQQEQVQ